MKNTVIIFLFLMLLPGSSQLFAQSKDLKPRLIVMTDGEIDDHSYMIRFLLYTCDVEVCAIIETNSMFQRHGLSDEGWYEKHLEAYGQVYPNLVKHHPGYPDVDELKALS